MDDRYLYQSKDIQITSTLAKFGRTTFPINGIGSVTIVDPRRTALYIIAGLLVIAGLFTAQARAGLILIGIAFALVALLQKSELKLHTASGDRTAYRSRNGKLLEEIKGAIESAATIRG